MGVKPETQFVDRVISKFRDLENCWLEKIQQQTIRGTPDFMGCVSGRFLALEFKARKGKLSEIQERKIENIKKCGGLAFVVDPTNADEILAELKKHGRDF